MNAGFAATFNERMRARSTYRFTFRQAVLIALLLHLLLLIAWAVREKPEVVKVEFKELNIKLGEVHLPSRITPHEKEEISLPATPQPPAPARPVTPEPPSPSPPAKRGDTAPNRLPDIQQPIPQPSQPKPQAAEPSPPVDVPKTVSPMPALSKPAHQAAPTSAPTPQAPPRKPASMTHPAYQRKTPPGNQPNTSPQYHTAQPARAMSDLALKQGARGETLGEYKKAEQELLENYGQELSKYLRQFRIYPPEAVKNQIIGKGIIKVELSRSGYVRSMEVVKKTGHTILDDAMEATVRRANPFPAIPEVESSTAFLFPICFDYRDKSHPEYICLK